MEKTDCELIGLTRAGNKEAFSQLIRRHQPRAVRVAFGMVGNETAAQEVAQEAMLQSYVSLDRLREPERFASWLHGIVLNVGRTYLREEQRKKLSWESLAAESHALAPEAPDPARIMEQRERERVRRQGKEYDLFVSTEAVEFGERLTLRFQVREAVGTKIDAGEGPV